MKRVMLITIMLLFLFVPVSARAADYVTYSGKAVFVSGWRIQAYEIFGKLAIRCESLPPYGFDILMDAEERTLRISDRALYSTSLLEGLEPGGYFTHKQLYRGDFQPALYAVPEITASGTVGSVIQTDIRFFLNGAEIPAYSADGGSYILLEDMKNAGYYLVDTKEHTKVVQELDSAFQSDIGPVAVSGLRTSHISVTNAPYRLVPFKPIVDGKRLATKLPVGIIPQYLLCSPMYVPLLATLEALRVGWSWDYSEGTLTIHTPDEIVVQAFDDYMPEFNYTIDVFELQMDIVSSKYGTVLQYNANEPYPPFLYNGMVYVSLKHIANAIGFDYTSDSLYPRTIRDWRLGDLRYTYIDEDFNAAHTFEMMDYLLTVDGITFSGGVDNVKSRGLRVTNKKTQEERVYIPMSRYGQMLAPMFTYNFNYMGNDENTGDTNVFTFILPSPSDAPRGAGVQYADRNSTLFVQPVFRGAEITDVRSVPILFTTEGGKPYFQMGEGGATFSGLGEMGFFYHDTLYMPVSIFANCFGYRLVINEDAFQSSPDRAVIVFNNANGQTGAQLSKTDMDRLLDAVYGSPYNEVHDVFRRAPNAFRCYVNMYNTDGAKWTIWFDNGWPFFLDASYENGMCMWRGYQFANPVTTASVSALIESYRPRAFSINEPYTSPEEALVLPKDPFASDIIATAAAKSLFRFGYMNAGINDAVNRRDFHEMLVFTIYSAYQHVDMFSFASWFTGLLSSNNARLLGYRFVDDGFPAFRAYPHMGLASYVHGSLGYSYALDPYQDITREEAVHSIEAVMTLFSGNKDHRAAVWSWIDGIPGDTLSKLDATAAMLELYAFYSSIQ